MTEAPGPSHHVQAAPRVNGAGLEGLPSEVTRGPSFPGLCRMRPRAGKEHLRPRLPSQKPPLGAQALLAHSPLSPSDTSVATSGDPALGPQAPPQPAPASWLDPEGRLTGLGARDGCGGHGPLLLLENLARMCGLTAGLLEGCAPRASGREEGRTTLIQDRAEVHAGRFCPSLSSPLPHPVHPDVPGSTDPPPPASLQQTLRGWEHPSLTCSSLLLEITSCCSLFLLGWAEGRAAAQPQPTRDPPSTLTLEPHLWGPASLPCSSR